MYNINGKYCGATIHGTLVETEVIAQVYDFCNHPIAENAKVVIFRTEQEAKDYLPTWEKRLEGEV